MLYCHTPNSFRLLVASLALLFSLLLVFCHPFSFRCRVCSFLSPALYLFYACSVAFSSSNSALIRSREYTLFASFWDKGECPSNIPRVNEMERKRTENKGVVQHFECEAQFICTYSCAHISSSFSRPLAYGGNMTNLQDAKMKMKYDKH